MNMLEKVSHETMVFMRGKYRLDEIGDGKDELITCRGSMRKDSMKIDRLIGIITILQQKKTVTTPYLAERFEVSRRTINRDIEDICKAGIPIVTTQGVNGGISIMEGFSLDTTVFTEQELAAIFTGLKTLDSVSGSVSAERLAQKIGGTYRELKK